MNILLQHPHSANEISGVVTCVEATARALKFLGHQVRILSTAEVPWRETGAIAAWADVIHLNSTHPWLTIQAKLRGKRLINSFHFPFWGTWKVTSQDRSLGFGGCFWRTISVFWSHGRGWRLTWNFAGYFSTQVLRLFTRVVCTMLAHHRIAPTQFIATDACLPFSIDVLPYPFDCHEVLAFKTPVGVRQLTFCYVGRVVYEKGPDLLVEAAEILSRRGIEVNVCLVGDGAQLASLRAEAQRLGMGPRFKATGKLPRGEALREMANSLSVVVPSRWDDPSPFTVLEAAALARPVIGSDRGGIPEITGPGLIFHAGFAAELADHMERLVKQPQEADRIGVACYDFVRQRCDPVRVAETLVRLYQKA